MLTDATAALVGIFTDSDLARLFESRRDGALDAPICSVMTANRCTAPLGSMMIDAVAILADRKISELPVIDDGRPAGLIDITDVVSMFPEAQLGAALEAPARIAPAAPSAAARGDDSGPPRPKHPLLNRSEPNREHA